MNPHPEGQYIFEMKALNQSGWLLIIMANSERLAAIFVAAFPEDEIDGKRVFFVEKNRAIVNELNNKVGTRISRILVMEETAIGRQRETIVVAVRLFFSGDSGDP